MTDDSSTFPDLGQQILRIIQRYSNSQEMLSEIAAFLGERFNADSCILIVDQASLLVVWPPQEDSDRLRELQVSLGDQSGLKTLKNSQNKQIIILNHFSQSGLILETVLAMTTVFRLKKNGILLLGSIKQRKWTESEKNSLENLADALSIAYFMSHSSDTAFLVDSSKSTNTMSPIVLRLYELKQQQLAQQQQLNEMKDNIIDAISDKARNPLSVMRIALEMLKQDNLPHALQQRSVSSLEEAWQQLNILINNIVTLKQLQANEITVTAHALSLQSFIEEIIQPLREKWQNDPRKLLNLELKFEALPHPFYTDPKYLQLIIEELLGNAANYADKESTIQVHLEPYLIDSEQYIMRIQNVGCPIEATETEQIFALFRRGKYALEKSIPGTGIGLSLVKGLVELLQGRIQLHREPSDKTGSDVITVTVTIPSIVPIANR